MALPTLKWFVAASLFATWGSVFAGDDLIRLVPSGPILPPLAPTAVSSNTLLKDVAGTLFQEAQPRLVQWGVDKELERIGAAALEEAARSGQAGALFKIRIGIRYLGLEASSLPIGNGVAVVGRGPSAQAVVYYFGLNILEEPMPAGVKLDEDSSGYVWISAQDGTATRYDIDKLERYARMVKASERASKDLEEAAKSQYLQGYGSMLARTAQSEQDRQAIQALLDSRIQAAAELSRIEGELNVRLEAAEKAARSAAMWNTLSSVFSVSSSVALASAASGQKVLTPSGQPPKTEEELTKALQSIATETKGLADAIRVKAETQRQAVQALQDSLVNAGVLRGTPIPQQDWLILK